MKKHKLGITFGAFDPLHQGHINLFNNALKQCDKLIVCVSDNDYIETHKGYKPTSNLAERVQSIYKTLLPEIVYYQTDFYNKKWNVENFKPDVIFVGNDWDKTTFTGEGLGVPVVYLPRTKGISGTQLRSNDI
jgi:glycerol-3-phosphate cytidylyltransferase